MGISFFLLIRGTLEPPRAIRGTGNTDGLAPTHRVDCAKGRMRGDAMQRQHLKADTETDAAPRLRRILILGMARPIHSRSY